MPPADPLPRLRSLCLAFPGASEKVAWGEPTFRAPGGKLFAMYASAATHHGNGRPAVWIKAMPENQRFVMESDPDRYFSPPYVGPGGWIGVWLDRRPPWAAIQELLEDGCRQVAKQPRAAKKTTAVKAAGRKPAARSASPRVTAPAGAAAGRTKRPR